VGMAATVFALSGSGGRVREVSAAIAPLVKRAAAATPPVFRKVRRSGVGGVGGRFFGFIRVLGDGQALLEECNPIEDFVPRFVFNAALQL
jgi:hypothetical protein